MREVEARTLTLAGGRRGAATVEDDGYGSAQPPTGDWVVGGATCGEHVPADLRLRTIRALTIASLERGATSTAHGPGGDSQAYCWHVCGGVGAESKQRRD